MLSRIVGFSLRNRFVVLVLAALLFGFGIFTASHSPLDVFPEFASPQVTVETEAPGLSAEEVESLVTLRLELAINGTPGLKTLKSISMPGVSSITAYFEDETDVYRARQLVAERIATVNRDLPANVIPPEIAPLTSASSTVEVIGLTSRAPFDPIAVRTYADWTLTPRILAVPGIAKVVTYGGRIAQYQVVVDPNALRNYNLALDDVETAAARSTTIAPSGTVETNGQRFPIRALAQARGPDDLKNAIVSWRDSTPLLLSQVASVRIGPEFPIGDALLNGEPAVVLLIARQPEGNTLDVTRALDDALGEMSRHLPPGITLHEGLFRQATFIEHAISNLRTALVIGVLLVAIVLFAFLLDFRMALISLLALPLSLFTAIVVLRALGATVNTMTLGGLAIALGEVVDDSIIDVENIHRRLGLNRALASPRPARDVILEASLEVRSAVVYATFLVALVFLPVFFLSGVAGKLFSPLAEAYVLSTLASLGVALLVTPAAASVLLAGKGRLRLDARLVGFLKRRYEAVLPRLLERPVLLAAGGAGLFALTAAGIPFLAGEFIPAFQEHDFIVHMVGLPGTALAESLRIGRDVTQRLLRVPGVVSVSQRAGRAELADEMSGPESSEFDVRLSPKVEDVSAVVVRIRQSLGEVPGFTFSVSQFLKERMEEVAGGEAAPVGVIIRGPDLDKLRDLGAAVGRTMESIAGARDVRVEPQTRVPQILIQFDRNKAAQLGARIGDLQSAVTAAFEGTQVAEVFQGQQVVPVVVKFPDSSRLDLDAIRNLPVRVASGVVPLQSLAAVAIADLPNEINRQDGSRRIVVTCDANGNVAGYSRRLKAALARLALPPGYSIDISGDYRQEQRSLHQLLLVGGAAMIGIFLLLFSDFRSARLATLVIVNLPLALVGALGAALLFRITLSLGAIVGFVTLFGITARNAIMLISHYRQLEQEEGMSFGPALVTRGSLDRLAPILMTALVTALALVPLAVSGTRPGQEIEHPMAVIIVGGLLSSTVLNLVMMPAFYLRWGKRKPR